jgi:hypothetical protein
LVCQLPAKLQGLDMLVARTYKVAVNSTPEPAILRDFSPALRNALESVQCITYYPAGAVLFVESQPSRGVLFLPRGRIKLMKPPTRTLHSADGREAGNVKSKPQVLAVTDR